MKKYILKYGITGDYYIGEYRDIICWNGVNNYVRVGEYCVVDSLDRAVPISEDKVSSILEFFGTETYTKHFGGPLTPLEYGEN